MRRMHRNKYLVVFLSQMAFSLPVCWGNPQGGVVAGGEASIQESGSSLKVTAGNRTIINWDSFSIGSGEITQFIQPGSDSALLNRVLGKQASEIMGLLKANGRIYLINPQGVIIGKDGVIDTAGFYASTLNVLDSAFLNGEDLLFSGDSTGSIVNFGTIECLSGSVAFIARKIDNQGKINAPDNEVALAIGQEVLLQLQDTAQNGRPFFIKVNIPEKGDNSGISHSGEIKALSQKLQNEHALALAVQGGDQSDALQFVGKEGKIYLVAEESKINISGSLSADSVSVNADCLYIAPEGIIEAPQGVIEVVSGNKLFNNEGTLSAYSGKIEIASASTFAHSGQIDASGNEGGKVLIQARQFLNAGKVIADGHQGKAGEIDISSQTGIIETSSALISADGSEGKIQAVSGKGDRFFTSGEYRARGLAPGQSGGQIKIDGEDIVLAAAVIDASGNAGGGKVDIGDGSDSLFINRSTKVNADALQEGNGGEISLYAREKNISYGAFSAKGGLEE